MRTWIARLALPAILTTAVVSGQQTPPQSQTIFRTTTDLFTTHLIVRDKQGRFIPDLRPDEIQVFEDGVPQKIANFAVSIGGRVVNDLSPAVDAPRPSSSGLILPNARPKTDISGRVFIIFIDDLHLQAADSPKVRDVLRQIRDTVLHEGDLIGYVSTGYSSIATDLSYDYKFKRFNEAIDKVMGSAMTTQEIISANNTVEGPAGLRHNSHVAFSTAYEILAQAQKFNTRRKAFIYVSNGYDFNPFKDARYKAEQEKYDMPLRNDTQNADGSSVGGQSPMQPFENPFERNGQQFADSDLISELAELTRTARRANVTFYTVDPRGLVAGPDINVTLSATEWRDYIENSVSSLKVLGDETGGFCICQTNDFRRGLQRIDNEMSDYYVIGYQSNNPDPMKVRRNVEIKVNRPDLQELDYTRFYQINRNRKR